MRARVRLGNVLAFGGQESHGEGRIAVERKSNCSPNQPVTVAVTSHQTQDASLSLSLFQHCPSQGPSVYCCCAGRGDGMVWYGVVRYGVVYIRQQQRQQRRRRQYLFVHRVRPSVRPSGMCRLVGSFDGDGCRKNGQQSYRSPLGISSTPPPTSVPLICGKKASGHVRGKRAAQ